jgi:hypothetical protein
VSDCLGRRNIAFRKDSPAAHAATRCSIAEEAGSQREGSRGGTKGEASDNQLRPPSPIISPDWVASSRIWGAPIFPLVAICPLRRGQQIQKPRLPQCLCVCKALFGSQSGQERRMCETHITHYRSPKRVERKLQGSSMLWLSGSPLPHTHVNGFRFVISQHQPASFEPPTAGPKPVITPSPERAGLHNAGYNAGPGRPASRGRNGPMAEVGKWQKTRYTWDTAATGPLAQALRKASSRCQISVQLLSTDPSTAVRGTATAFSKPQPKLPSTGSSVSDKRKQRDLLGRIPTPQAGQGNIVTVPRIAIASRLQCAACGCGAVSGLRTWGVEVALGSGRVEGGMDVGLNIWVGLVGVKIGLRALPGIPGAPRLQDSESPKTTSGGWGKTGEAKRGQYSEERRKGPPDRAPIKMTSSHRQTLRKHGTNQRRWVLQPVFGLFLQIGSRFRGQANAPSIVI